MDTLNVVQSHMDHFYDDLWCCYGHFWSLSSPWSPFILMLKILTEVKFLGKPFLIRHLESKGDCEPCSIKVEASRDCWKKPDRKSMSWAGNNTQMLVSSF